MTDLDRWLAENVMMEYERRGSWYDVHRIDDFTVTCRKNEMYNIWRGAFRDNEWQPTRNIEQAFMVEEKIKGAGLENEYIHQLIKVCDVHNSWQGAGYDELFKLAHATPEQRCLAAQKAWGEK